MLSCKEDKPTEPTNSVPNIQSISASPPTVKVNETTLLSCVAIDADGDNFHGIPVVSNIRGITDTIYGEVSRTFADKYNFRLRQEFEQHHGNQRITGADQWDEDDFKKQDVDMPDGEGIEMELAEREHNIGSNKKEQVYVKEVRKKNKGPDPLEGSGPLSHYFFL